MLCLFSLTVWSSHCRFYFERLLELPIFVFNLCLCRRYIRAETAMSQAFTWMCVCSVCTHFTVVVDDFRVLEMCYRSVLLWRWSVTRRSVWLPCTCMKDLIVVDRPGHLSRALRESYVCVWVSLRLQHEGHCRLSFWRMYDFDDLESEVPCCFQDYD